MPLSRFFAHCGHGRAAALNVLTAALDEDPRTVGTPTTFVRSAAELRRGLAALPEQQPAVVGWSFTSADFARAASELRQMRPACGAGPVLHVAGGPHASAEPLATLLAGFDLCALGEGEATIGELVAAMREGRDPRAGSGVAFLDGGRFVSRGPGRQLPLDEVPAFNRRWQRINALEISRGCTHRCAFCQTPRLFPGPPRHRSVANVREQVGWLRRLGVRYLRFLAPNALAYGSADGGLDLDALEQLLEAVRDAVGPHVKLYLGTFPSEVRPDHVSLPALRVLKRAVANRDLAIGVQSGAPRVLDAMGRGYDVEQARASVRVALAAGFRPQVDLIVGYPGETGEDRARTLDLAEWIGQQGARVRCHAFMPLPGTPLAGADPEPLDPASLDRLARLESAKVLHGPWRVQRGTASRAADADDGSRGRFAL